MWGCNLSGRFSDYSGAAHVGEERPAAGCESVCAVFDQFADHGGQLLAVCVQNCLLFAHQRNDIGDKIGYVINTVKYGVQLAVLYFMRDYYAYIIVALLSGVVSNIVTAIVVDKLYPQYKAMGKLPKEDVQIINKRIKDLFTSKIGSVVYDSADTLVISAFLGLTALAKYQNYFCNEYHFRLCDPDHQFQLGGDR